MFQVCVEEEALERLSSLESAVQQLLRPRDTGSSGQRWEIMGHLWQEHAKAFDC